VRFGVYFNDTAQTALPLAAPAAPASVKKARKIRKAKP
jgi:hypothetical protein